MIRLIRLIRLSSLVGQICRTRSDCAEFVRSSATHRGNVVAGGLRQVRAGGCRSTSPVNSGGHSRVMAGATGHWKVLHKADLDAAVHASQCVAHGTLGHRRFPPGRPLARIDAANVHFRSLRSAGVSDRQKALATATLVWELTFRGGAVRTAARGGPARYPRGCLARGGSRHVCAVIGACPMDL